MENLSFFSSDELQIHFLGLAWEHQVLPVHIRYVTNDYTLTILFIMFRKVVVWPKLLTAYRSYVFYVSYFRRIIDNVCALLRY
jgi:hypothetical protein